MLLTQGLRAATPKGTVDNFVFVGGRALRITTSSVSLTTLTGGVASSPSNGDLVIVAINLGGDTTTDIDLTMSTSGYTEVADLYANDTYDTNLAVYYKRMGTTPDTSFTFPTSDTYTQEKTIVVHVWRNVSTTPLDVTRTTWTATNTGLPVPPSISPITNGTMVLAIGGGAVIQTAKRDFSTPTGLSNFFTVGGTISGSSGAYPILGIGSVFRSTSGSYTPPAFSFVSGADSTANSAAAVTLALRPA